MDTSLGKNRTRLFLSIHGQSWECSDGDIIGREGTVALEFFRGERVLSRRHVAVRYINDEWFVELCPTARNLTWINEAEMLPGQLYSLGPQSVITVEEVQFTLLTQEQDLYMGDVGASVGSGWASPGFSADGFSHGQSGEAEFASNANTAGGSPGILDQMPGCVMVFDAMDYCIWSNAEAARLFQSEEVPSTVESLCLSFHREDEMLLKGCISQLKEGVSRSESGLRIVDSASGTVVGLLTLWMLRSGGQLIVSALAEPDKGQSLAGLKLLSETYLSPDFQGADLKICFQTIAENGLDVLRCDKVSIWLIDSRDSLAKRSISVCRGKPQEDEVIRIQPGFCRSYFDRLLEESHSAFEGDESPAMTVLRDLGFAAHASKAILSVPLLQGTMTGIVAFEWNEWTGELSEEARLSALMVASLCLSAAASISHQATLRQLRMREEQMAKELADAEYYVRQILPPPLTGEIDLRWMLKPSAQLGGDAFGYHWVDEDRFAIYLLDVVGHGTGAALLSISAMNSVRAQILPDTDFGNPAAVLAGLNRGFQMETQNDMTFTIWYGIYYRSSRQLCYASAGHPPALLIDPSRANQCTELSTDGLIIGHIDDFEYENAAVNVPPGAKLYVLSDGAFELERPDGAPWPYEQFVAAVRSTGSMENGEVEYLYDRAQQVLEGGELQDDFTMLRVRFPE